MDTVCIQWPSMHPLDLFNNVVGFYWCPLGVHLNHLQFENWTRYVHQMVLIKLLLIALYIYRVNFTIFVDILVEIFVDILAAILVYGHL